MRTVLQRVREASTDGQTVGSIKQGILALFGVHKEDTAEKIPWLAKKLVELRIFCDENGKMNKSLLDVGGEVLIVSQFTLYADCSKGRRPGFADALPGEQAKKLYQEFVQEVSTHVKEVQTGTFGAKMDLSLVNDGPVTLIVEI